MLKCLMGMELKSKRGAANPQPLYLVQILIKFQNNLLFSHSNRRHTFRYLRLGAATWIDIIAALPV